MKSYTLKLICLAVVALASGPAISEATFSYTSSTGASISYTDPNCTGFTISASNVLSCTTSGEPQPAGVGTCAITPASKSVTLPTSSAVLLTASCANEAALPVTWEWRRDGSSFDTATAIDGANAKTYTTPSDLAAGTYKFRLRAKNENDTTGSDAVATLTINPEPVDETPVGCTPVTNSTKYTNFDYVFNTPGVPFGVEVQPGKISAYEFSNTKWNRGYINVYASNAIFEMAVSECPGNMNVASTCYKRGNATNLYWSSTDAAKCLIPINSNKKMYMNIRNAGTSTLGMSLKNAAYK